MFSVEPGIDSRYILAEKYTVSRISSLFGRNPLQSTFATIVHNTSNVREQVLIKYKFVNVAMQSNQGILNKVIKEGIECRLVEPISNQSNHFVQFDRQSAVSLAVENDGMQLLAR